MMRLPTRHYAGYEIAGLKTGCAPKKFTWSADPRGPDAMAASRIEYVVESLGFERK